MGSGNKPSSVALHRNHAIVQKCLNNMPKEFEISISQKPSGMVLKSPQLSISIEKFENALIN